MRAKIESYFYTEYELYRGSELLESRHKKHHLLPKEYELGSNIIIGLKEKVQHIARKTVASKAGYAVGVKIPADFTYEESYCNESLCVVHLVGTPFDYKILGVSVTGSVYRILRMAARGRVHIYGLSNKEFYDRMSKTREKYNKTQSRQLLKLFKEGSVTTMAKV